ncbi:MAG TPA: retropepsin-like aspartic protease, partial [Methylomirabilota bacterium]
AEGLQSVPERYRERATPLGLTNSPVSSTPAVSTTTSSAETVIRFTPGKHIVVDARINGTASAKLYLDTGAGGTLISPRVLAAAGVPLSRGRRGVTRGVASDTNVDVMMVSIDSLEVGEAKVGRMVVSSYDMSMSEVDGLLGQDFLAKFNVNIDPTNGVVKLTPK